MIHNMENALSKNAFYRFLEMLKQVDEDVCDANQYTLQRYKKFPLGSRNLQFNYNFMTSMKGQA